MRYADLYKYFLESKEQPGLEGIKESGGFHPYMMKPEDIQSVLNAVDSFDLYNRPNKTAGGSKSFDALNFEDPTAIGGPKNDIFFSSEESKRLPFNDVRKINSPLGPRFDKYALQGVYEHELGHATDPRLNRLRGLRNRGFVMNYEGMPQEVRALEEPAMNAETRFWQSIQNGTFNL